MELSNSYAELPDRFFQRIDPVPVAHPRLLLWNAPLAEALGIHETLPEDESAIAAWFAGNARLPGSEPLALAYAGHQFGHFVPQLGDGRAHLLGEVRDRSGRLWDVQLKGSGPTAFSRRGDGRCALGPAIREFIMSEAMHALGVPTTRTLAVVTTGEPVLRERRLPGAIVTRVAASHLRVGTFQYFAARRDQEALEALLDYAIQRHYPDLDRAPDRASAFVRAVTARQIDLVVDWMRVGLIHGVMNTDNTAISGETIDYGPCAMLGIYDPETVYSSIDARGRYAFGNQPLIAGWNMARLAECLLPPPEVESIVAAYPQQLEAAWFAMMGKKLGIATVTEDDHDLVTSLLARLQQRRLDYTIAFQRLDDLGEWSQRWRARADALERMERANPLVIPRNHHVEAALEACVRDGDLEPTRRLLTVVRSPYTRLDATPDYQEPPPDGDAGYQTFCGT